jgi:GT2 family glycosyltransferase
LSAPGHRPDRGGDPSVLVSILNYNSFEPTIEAIESFRAQTYPAMKLQMVDNASTTDCVERIERIFPDLEIVRSGSNLGYTGGNNLALERGIAEGFDYVLICNEDISVDRDAVAHLVETARNRPDAGVLGAVEVDYETGRPRATGGTRFPDWRFRMRWPVDPAPAGAPSARVLYVQGALVMFSRAALEAGIRFDDALFIYWDEIELGYQLREKGLAAYVDHRVLVRHRNKPATFTIRAGYLQQRNRLYLATKYFRGWKRWAYLAYSNLLEIPVKLLVRTAQGHGGFARACLLGQWDGLRGRMGKGRLESFSLFR